MQEVGIRGSVQNSGKLQEKQGATWEDYGVSELSCQREMNEENALSRPEKARSGTNTLAFLVRKTLKNDNALTQTHIHANNKLQK